ncbi:MAG TPA: hypothetical protein VEZ90_04335, partial [Blastocatellia bacterium]|nr:hypothetical protein [Blastocatellia bacterium]
RTKLYKGTIKETIENLLAKDAVEKRKVLVEKGRIKTETRYALKKARVTNPLITCWLLTPRANLVRVHRLLSEYAAPLPVAGAQITKLT